MSLEIIKKKRWCSKLWSLKHLALESLSVSLSQSLMKIQRIWNLFKSSMDFKLLKTAISVGTSVCHWTEFFLFKKRCPKKLFWRWKIQIIQICLHLFIKFFFFSILSFCWHFQQLRKRFLLNTACKDFHCFSAGKDHTQEAYGRHLAVLDICSVFKCHSNEQKTVSARQSLAFSDNLTFRHPHWTHFTASNENRSTLPIFGVPFAIWFRWTAAPEIQTF